MFKEPIIKVKNLVKKYGELTAVNGISFEVMPGEVFSLLGPNGAGKTTTLEIIETLRSPTSGDIEVGGFDYHKNHWDIKSIIGVQLQQAGFYPGLRLVEILDMFAALYNVQVDPMKLLEMVGLREKAKSEPKDLSGGQRQRFSVATTLVNKPQIAFLDEPTTGLDPQARRKLWDIVRQIKSEGVTVMMTTHYLDEAEVLSDRVAIMDEGKIIKIDTPNHLIDELLAGGFKKETQQKAANLEDVFLQLTGKHLREES